jgi:hypothetical protein
MATQRYDVRQEPNGTWTVFDVFTGWPALIDGKVPAIGLHSGEAGDLAKLMNLQDAKRRGMLRPI